MLSSLELLSTKAPVGSSYAQSKQCADILMLTTVRLGDFSLVRTFLWRQLEIYGTSDFSC